MFNKYKAVAALLCEATAILDKEYREKGTFINMPFIGTRVGAGKRTCFTANRIGGNNKEYMITIGAKMVESKCWNKEVMSGWLSSREIKKYNYFNGELTIQNSLMHTVMHEYAHFVTHLKYGREKGISHGKDFYSVLREIYAKDMHVSVVNFMSRHSVFTELDFENNDAAKANNGLSSNEVCVGDVVEFELKGEIEPARVVRVNPKTVSVETKKGAFRVPYCMISKSKASTVEVLSEISAYKPDFKRGQFIKFVVRGREIVAKIERVNQSTLTVFSDVSKFRVPFRMATLVE